MDIVEVRRTTGIGVGTPTFGEVYVNGHYIGVTLERGRDRIIPAGNYPARVEWSNKFHRNVVKLDQVPGRTFIEIHAGNSIDDTEGCILIGESRHGNSIWNSRTALTRLLSSLRTSSDIQVVVR